jgi:hypothetical protein
MKSYKQQPADRAGRIMIRTRLNAACDRGAESIELSLAITPTNLLRAATRLAAIRKSKERNFGNIGAGVTWLEVNRTPVDDADLADLTGKYDPPPDPQGFGRLPSFVERAQALLDQYCISE